MKFPKGFLNTLSKSCIKELEEKANIFKYEHEFDNVVRTLSYASFQSSPNILETPDGIRRIVPNSSRYATDKTFTIMCEGFPIREGTYVNPLVEEIRALKEKTKKYDELISSLDTIKGVLK